MDQGDMKLGNNKENFGGGDMSLGLSDPSKVALDMNCNGGGGGGSRPHTPTLQPPRDTAWHSARKLIYVPKSAQKGFAVGFWPIPEAFWPDPNASNLVSTA